jgi:hypothetical protein
MIDYIDTPKGVHQGCRITYITFSDFNIESVEWLSVQMDQGACSPALSE